MSTSNLIAFDLDALPDDLKALSVSELIEAMLDQASIHSKGTILHFDIEHETPTGDVLQMSVAFTEHSSQSEGSSDESA